jgi:hypothetical protein
MSEQWKFIGRNWLLVPDHLYERWHLINLVEVKWVVWWENENGKWVAVLMRGEDAAATFKAEDFPTREELEKFLSQGGGEQ